MEQTDRSLGQSVDSWDIEDDESGEEEQAEGTFMDALMPNQQI
jgi:hypothetical protein